MCINEGCTTRPNFNIEGQTKALFCSKHKKENMVDVKNKKCEFETCKIQPNFNFENNVKAKYCSNHKKEGMIDIKNKKCIYEKCNTRPIYNKDGETKPLYCLQHKHIGMIDVTHNTCKYKGCNIRPNFNIEGQINALYCAEHKKENMVNILSKTCEQDGCKIHPSYNIDGLKNARFCSSHKKEGMINIKNKTCNNEWCSTIVQDKYEGYCLYCFINMFPDKPVSRNYKTKERATVEHILNKYPELTWTADKVVKDGCSKRRPDLLLDLGYQIIIIEVDENQHTDYDCSCENKRIMELSQDLGHRPIIFIRFNPDDYLDTGNTITSCWSNNKNGICTIKKSKQDEWIQRLNSLTSQLDYWIDPVNKTNKTIETVQLFYDI